MQKWDVWRALRWSHRDRGSGVRPVPRPCIKYTGIYLTTEEITENISQCSRRALSWSAVNAIRLLDLVIAGDDLDWPAVCCRRWLSRQATMSTLGQFKYLPICRTRGFLTLANLESKLSVRALMWLANSWTPRSSCICLLLTYQRAPVARRRHLHCNTCNLWTWERNSTRGTHSPSLAGWAAYIAGLRSWWIDHSSYSGGHPAYPSFEQPFSWRGRCEETRWVVYIVSTPDNE